MESLSAFVVFCSFDTGIRVKISGETPVNTFFNLSVLRKTKISLHQSSQCSFLPNNFSQGREASRCMHNEGKCNNQQKKRKKVHGYFQFMQPTVTSSYFQEDGFVCYFKMAALSLTLILSANWAYSCLPLVRMTSG